MCHSERARLWHSFLFVILSKHASGFVPACHSEVARLWRGSEESQTISQPVVTQILPFHQLSLIAAIMTTSFEEHPGAGFEERFAWSKSNNTGFYDIRAYVFKSFPSSS